MPLFVNPLHHLGALIILSIWAGYMTAKTFPVKIPFGFALLVGIFTLHFMEVGEKIGFLIFHH